MTDEAEQTDLTAEPSAKEPPQEKLEDNTRR